MMSLRILSVGFLCAALSGMAEARSWKIQLDTLAPLMATMQSAEHVCPNPFLPVEMFVETDRFQKQEVRRRTPEHFKSAKTDREHTVGSQ